MVGNRILWLWKTPNWNEEPYNEGVARFTHRELPAAESPRLWPYFMTWGFYKAIRSQDQGVHTIVGTGNPQFHCGDHDSY